MTSILWFLIGLAAGFLFIGVWDEIDAIAKDATKKGEAG